MRQRIDLIQSIVNQHAALALSQDADPQAEMTDDTPYGVAWAAARRLGFIAADAECIAKAWQAQCERTSLFDTADWPCHAPDFGLIPQADSPAFAPCPQALGLYAVLPSADWVARMARAGVPTLQLRFKSSDPQQVRKEIEAAVEAVKDSNSLLFINDHWREAIAARAYGVHLGQEDLDTLSADDLAEIRSAGLRLGLSTHGYAEMLRAASIRPSYLALGAVFPTTLKAMATAPQGPARLGAYARLMRGTPLVAIGGIAKEHLCPIAATGVGSFAVVRAITAAPDPEAAATELMQAWTQAVKAQKT